MPDLKNEKFAIPLVIVAGILWSFGPYVVRHIDQAEIFPQTTVNLLRSSMLMGSGWLKKAYFNSTVFVIVHLGVMSILELFGDKSSLKFANSLL